MKKIIILLVFLLVILTHSSGKKTHDGFKLSCNLKEITHLVFKGDTTKSIVRVRFDILNLRKSDQCLLFLRRMYNANFIETKEYEFLGETITGTYVEKICVSSDSVHSFTYGVIIPKNLIRNKARVKFSMIIIPNFQKGETLSEFRKQLKIGLTRKENLIEGILQL